MKLISIETLSGQNYEVLGLVKGNIVQSKHIGRDILAVFKTIVGGEIKGYTDMLSTSAVMEGAAEIIAFGTAVKISN